VNDSPQQRAHAYKGRAISGVKWTTLSTALSTGFYVVQTVVLARLLEPRDFGLMAMAMVVISVAIAYVDMGLSSAIIQRQHCTENELSSLYWLNILAGLVVFVVVFLLAPVIAGFYREPRVTHLVQLCALMFVIAPIGQQYQMLLQKELLFRPLATIEVCSRAVGTVVAIGAAVMGAGVYSLVVGQLTVSSSASLLLMLRGHRIYRPRLHFARSDVRGYLRFGLYQMGERGINTLHDNLDKLIIGFWLGAESLGYYNFAWNLALMPVSRINPILTRTAFPLFSRLQDDLAVLKSGYLKLLRLISIINFPLFFGLCALAPLAVPAIFGQKWLPAVTLLQVFCLVGAIYSTGNPVGSLILARGRADLGFWWNASIFVVQAIALALSAWLGGVMTVALTLLVLQILYFPAGYHFLVRTAVGPCWRQYISSVAPAFACSVLMLGAVSAALHVLLRWKMDRYLALALLVSLGAAIYGLAAFALQGSEIRNLVKIVLHRESPAPQSEPAGPLPSSLPASSTPVVASITSAEP
jgi:O-antigen/teichoic acid export membrane protein